MRRALAFATLAICTACQAPVPAASTTTPLPTFTPAPDRSTSVPVVVQAVAPQPAPQPAVRPITTPSPASLPLSLLAGRSGADLRVSLNVLLEEDALLLTMAMQAASAARLDEQIGVSSMLDDNAATLAGIIGTQKGAAAAQDLLEAWRAETADLVGYAQTQTQSPQAHRAAVANGLATGDFSQTQASDVVQRRMAAEQSLADSIRAHEPARSAEQLSSLLAAADDLAHPLSSAMAVQMPDLVPANTEGGDVDVRLRLEDGFTAWTLLTAAAAEAAADGRSADAQAYSVAAGASASNIGSQLSSSFSSDVGGGVVDRLRGQTSAYVAAATQTNRPQDAADVDRLRAELDALLSGADPLLAPGLLNQQLRASDQPLLTAADAFAARDYATAFARIHEAVRQTQKPAETLALAIIDRYPARYLVLATPTATSP